MTRTTTIALALMSRCSWLTGCASLGSHRRDQDRSGTLRSTRRSRHRVRSRRSFGVALVPFQFYNVDDGTGEITVLSRSARSMPAKGARVEVKGRVNEVASFGGRSSACTSRRRAGRARTD